MIADDFFNKYNGKGVDWDGYYGFQCVDLYRQYVKEVVDCPQSPGVTGAADIWDTYLNEYFDRIANTPEGVPIKGDILIWSKNAGGGFGHVSIASVGNTDTFTSFDQNWPVGSLCHFQAHNYTNVLGWLRAKVQAVPTPEPCEITDSTKIPQLDNQEVQAVRSRLNDLSVSLTGAQGRIVELEAKVAQLESNPPTLDPRIQQAKDILYGKNFFWVKLSKLKALLPQ